MVVDSNGREYVVILSLSLSLSLKQKLSVELVLVLYIENRNTRWTIINQSISRTRGEIANHYYTEAVQKLFNITLRHKLKLRNNL